ncbi:MAG: FG-GAP-like repeat-containing protein [Bacteroidota bacterium]
MKKVILLTLVLLSCLSSFGTGEASTYFEIFVPPNNDRANRHVVVVITALYDSTFFELIDDDADGDDDDSASGWLNAGQSYIQYIKDGAVNDDAPPRGGQRRSSKQDGDFFIIKTSKLVFASQSTNSDWQHDWVPATNKTSKGTKFIVFSPPTSFSPRDLNVFAYEDSTVVTIKSIHTSTTTSTGYTQVDISNANILVQREINVGQDIIFYHTDGRNIMQSGGTYLIETNKPVTVQYGALWGNARDGGGFVPSENGSSSGELFYFGVPYQARREQEIRVVSWEDSTEIFLDKFVNNSWQEVENWTLDRLKAGEWISYSGNHAGVFRLRSSEGKPISVSEANWLETGRPGTSDIASMVSSQDGTSAGKSFLVYMSPPGKENDVTIPGTTDRYSFGSHAYLFARKTAQVTVVDAFTNGQKINRTYTVPAGRYIDCFLDLNEWNSIYNGNGNPNSGPERPYLLITSDKPISVFATNFNDNWMSYFGTSQTQDFKLEGTTSVEQSEPGDSVVVKGDLILQGDSLTNPDLTVVVGDGAEVVSCNFVNETEEITYEGDINPTPKGETIVTFDSIPGLSPDNTYYTETELIVNGNENDGDPILDNTVISVETVVSGEVDSAFQQASSSNGVTVNTDNYAPKIFFRIQDGSHLTGTNNSQLGLALGDYNGDGLLDIFMGSYDSGEPDLLYANNGDRSFSLVDTGAIASNIGSSVGGSWGDMDNDGDLDLFVSRIGEANVLYKNLGRGRFEEMEVEEIYRFNGHCYNASWIDYDNNGLLDIYVSDFLSNRPNILFRNMGDGEFDRIETALPGNGSTIGAGWCDYDNDGDMDLFAPNGNGEDNFLYRNNGNGRFVRVNTGEIVNDGGNSAGCSWVDYDNDGDFDLYVTNSERQANFLYQNNGDGTFTRITEGAIANDQDRSQGSTWGDFDNDGDLDLYVTNSSEETRRLYMNNGDGTFNSDVVEPVTRDGSFSLGTATGDLDNDGDLDVLVANHFENPNQYYTNNGNENNWIQVRLVGTNSNRLGIGAQIRLKSSINGETVRQMRQVTGQSGGGANAQNPLIAHFGLGDASVVDTIEVRWPSGYRQFVSNISVNQRYEIVEEQGILVIGRIFMDADSSCSLTSPDIGIPNQKVLINPGEIVALTDSLGIYKAYLQEGEYTLNQMKHPAWTQLCPTEESGFDLTVVEGGGNASPRYTKHSPIENCSWGCTASIEGNQNLTINPGEQICVEEGSTVNGTITFNNGGTLVICGTANLTNINFNGNGAGLIILGESGSLSIPSLNLNSTDAVLVNYSSNLTITNGLSLQGKFENYGDVAFTQLNINTNAILLNAGTLSITGDLNNNALITNYGDISVNGTLNNNGNSTFDNFCQLSVGNNLNQNGDMRHSGYLEVENDLNINGNSLNELRKGSKIVTGNLTVNGDINGPNESGASIEVSGTTTINGGTVLYGHFDICDANGIETMYGALTDHVTTDCDLTIEGIPCDNGLGESVYEGYDFANRPNCINSELSVSLATQDLRRGFENDYLVRVSNNGGGIAEEYTLRILMDENLVPTRSQPEWTRRTKVDSTFIMEWDLGPINPLEVKTVTLTDSVSRLAVLGKFVEVTAEIDIIANECDTLNNTYTSVDEIVGSYDPNDKQVWPKGAGKGGYIRVEDTLTYKIRFQNVGSFFASRVVIYDTLSRFLDLSSFEPGAMSHEGSVTVSEDGIAVFKFDNIFLPDSASDEEGSQGFVMFKIAPKPNLVHGDTILNRAGIQFDFNEHIITNYVQNVITDRLTLEDDYFMKVVAFPNPVRDESTIMISDRDNQVLPIPLASVKILTTTGIEMQKWTKPEATSVIIRKQDYRPGTYIIMAEDIYQYVYIGRFVIE